MNNKLVIGIVLLAVSIALPVLLAGAGVLVSFLAGLFRSAPAGKAGKPGSFFHVSFGYPVLHPAGLI